MSFAFGMRRILFVVLIYAVVFAYTRNSGLWGYILGAIAGTALAVVALAARRGKVNPGAIAVVAVFTLLGVVSVPVRSDWRMSDFDAVFHCAVGGSLGAALGVGIRTLIWPPPRKPRKPMPLNADEAERWEAGLEELARNNRSKSEIED